MPKYADKYHRIRTSILKNKKNNNIDLIPNFKKKQIDMTLYSIQEMT
tara:strand:- start:3430 stop:3570 length:141 start_codon:yes stop_codon:yes gene_type:complete